MSDDDSPVLKRKERRPSRKIIMESPDSPLHARPRLDVPAMPGSPTAVRAEGGCTLDRGGMTKKVLSVLRINWHDTSCDARCSKR